MELEALLNQEKIHIAIISETWLDAQSYFRVSGYNTFRCDRDDGYGGVAILTHKSVKAQQSNLQHPNTRIEILRVKILNCDHLENIVSIYCPPSVRTTTNDWDQILALVNRKTLIAGDLNGHHTNWSTKIDTRGGQIFDAMLENNFISLNDGTSTRVKLRNGIVQRSSPDLTLASTDIALKLNWTVLNESLGSDHLMIKITTSILKSRTTQVKRNFKKADWVKYKSLLETAFIDFTLPSDHQNAYNNFIEVINKVANQVIPNIRMCEDPLRQNKFIPRPYWNQDLSKRVAERRRALAVFRRNPTPTNLEMLQSKLGAAQCAIRKESSKSWQGFCNSIGNVVSSSEMWNKMKWLKGYKTLRSNTINREKAESLLSCLAPDYVVPKAPTFNRQNNQLSSPITVQELINSTKQSDTAPGTDHISYSMIKNLPEMGKSILVCLFNRFLSASFVPTQWKDVKIIPVPKPGVDRCSISSIRPIALLSCLCKVFHTIITRRIEWYFEKNLQFSDETVGFRRTRSCMDNLTRLVTRIQCNYTKGLTTVGCFIDINNAYNNINLLSLLNTLYDRGVGAQICGYLWEYLHSRRITINFDSQESLTRITGTGIPQGDPLSPLLFNVATIDICKNLRNVFVSQYADDFVIYTGHKTLADAVNITQVALNLFNDMVENIGLSISHRKTKVCAFTRGNPRNHNNNIILKINNNAIQQVETVKYLGMWLDRRLKWGQHINYIQERTLKFLNVFKALAGSKWGIHPKHLRRLYVSIIRSRIDYGCYLYDSSIKSHLYKMDKVQNQAMRVVGGFIKSTPIHVMESELCIQPLNIRRNFLAAKFWFKSRSIEGNITITILEKLNNLCQHQYWRHKKIPLLITVHRNYYDHHIQTNVVPQVFSLNTWISSLNISKNINVNIEGVATAKRNISSIDMRNICIEYIKNKYCTFYEIYTDGSRDTHGCGAAFFDPQIDICMQFKIEVDLSIMHCELIALSEALSYVATLDRNKCIVLSDSKSALLHLARLPSRIRGHPIAYNILDSICKLRKSNKEVIIQWIPSHVGIIGNEKADLAARHAVSDGIPYSCLPLHSEKLSEVKINCSRMWNEYFDERSRTKGIWYKTVQCQPPRYPWFETVKLNRQYTITLLRLRSGHIPSNKFKWLMGISDTPNCPECDVVEDVQHVLMECVRNEVIRQDMRTMLDQGVGTCNSILASPLSDEARMLTKLYLYIM